MLDAENVAKTMGAGLSVAKADRMFDWHDPVMHEVSKKDVRRWLTKDNVQAQPRIEPEDFFCGLFGPNHQKFFEL